MSFIGGVFTGIGLTIGLMFILLVIAKVLGFSMYLRNEWRTDHGYWQSPYSRYELGRGYGRYGCTDCFYRREWQRQPVEKIKYKPDDDLNDEAEDEPEDDILGEGHEEPRE